MVFYAAFNSISVISRRQPTLYMLSWVSPVLGWAMKCLAQGHSLNLEGMFGMQQFLVDLYQVCSYDAPGVKTGPTPGVISQNNRNKEGRLLFVRKMIKVSIQGHHGPLVSGFLKVETVR